MALNLFGRLANLWRGMLSLWMSDIERQNPEIAYENAINSMVEKYSTLKRATASILRRREELEQRHATQSKELARVAQDLNTAVETDQDDLALVLIEKKNQLESEIAELETEMKTAVSDAEEAKTSLMQVQAEIKKVKAEKDAMLAKLQSAQARIRIQEQLDGLSVDSEVKALETVREHIKTTVAQAKLEKELGESSLDGRLAALRNKSGELDSRKQLEQLKAAAAAKAATQKRSM